jgi:hypothetical protein
VGSNILFNVIATGPGLAYQWRFNGSPIAGQTNASLLMANVQRTNGGSYSVVVSNAFGSATSSIAVLTLLNRAPTAFSQSVAVDEDTATAIPLLASDPDGDPLTFLVAAPLHGTLTATPTNQIYTPAPDYHGPDSFLFLVTDGFVFSGPAAVTLTVRPVNDPPVAHSQSIVLDEDTAIALTLDATDVDGDTLSYTTSAPAHGTVTGTAPNLIYTPAANYFGPDSFTFQVHDGQADSAIATVALTIRPLNDAPVARATVAPLLMLSAGQTNLLILSPNGTNALVILDASLSSDAEHDVLQFLWLADGAPMPFADGVLTTNEFPVGPHTITLVAFDHTAHGIATVQFEIITAGQAVNELSGQVEDSNLSRKNKRPLLDKLKAAQKAFTDGNYKHGAHELEDFQKKLRGPVAHDQPDLAQALTNAAQNILDGLASR